MDQKRLCSGSSCTGQFANFSFWKNDVPIYVSEMQDGGVYRLTLITTSFL